MNQGMRAVNFWIRGACATVLCSTAMALAAQEAPVPKHLQLAREFLANTQPEDNLYVDKGERFVKAPSDEPGAKYVVHTDCTGFVKAMIDRAYGYRPKFSTKFYGNAYSLSDWVDGAARGETFTLVPSMADVKPGDVIMWKYLVPPKYAPTHRGHVMIVSEAPTRVMFSRLFSTTQWKVRVIDSSGPHGKDDTRYVPGLSADRAGDVSSRHSGVGEGSVYIFTNDQGQIVAASHGYSKSTINIQNENWFTVAARLNKTSR